MKSVWTISFFLGFVLSAFAQMGLEESNYVFDDSSVPRIDILIDQDSLDEILDPANWWSDHEYPATFIFTKDGDSYEVNQIGFRLRGNTSRAAAKKSFKISINSFETKKFFGLEKLNLNGEKNDPSLMRSKLCWDLFSQMGVPSARANHVELYINGEYKGLYLNTEHIDEEFVRKRFPSNSGNLYKCLYPADLAYKGEDPDLYKEEFNGRRAYELKINNDIDDYTDIASLISILDQVPSDAKDCLVDRWIDVDLYISALAVDIVTGNWDGPLNKNNYYLYFDTDRNNFVYFPFDLDNTFGIDWFGVDWATANIYRWFDNAREDRPLQDHILSVPEYRSQLGWEVDRVSDILRAESYDAELEGFRDLLRSAREADPYASLDYGWDLDHYDLSFDMSIGDHVKYGLRNYISTRLEANRIQIDNYNPLPIIQRLRQTQSAERITWEISLRSLLPIDSIMVNYTDRDNNTYREKVDFSSQDMWRFETTLLSPGRVEYSFEIYESDGDYRPYPRCGEYATDFGSITDDPLVVNEFMADNEEYVADQAGDFDDWIELYNTSENTIFLANYFLTDDPGEPDKWALPLIPLAPDSYLIIWADDDLEQDGYHANFKLSKDGEFVGLYKQQEGSLLVVDTISFGPLGDDQSFGRIPNGTGEFIILDEASIGENNEGATSAGIVRPEIPELRIWPNPSSGLITLGSSIDMHLVWIWSAGGSLVVEVIPDDLSCQINDPQEGVYFVQVMYENGQRAIERFEVIRTP